MKKFKVIFISILIAGSTLYTLNHIIPILKLDGYSGLTYRILFNTDDSKYSKEYSNSKFLQIKNGMSVKDVYNILGDPIRADKKGTEYFCLWYSMSPNSTHYRKRNIIFENNRVTKIHSEYYID